MEQRPDYTKWSTEELVDQVTRLEQLLKAQTDRYKPLVSGSYKISSPTRRPKNPRTNREFDPTKYSTRFVALKFAYLGQRYNGLEYHSKNKTPLPTVEEELWKALMKARLIFPTAYPLSEGGEVDWQGCDFSKSGRTDKGVSAFGQVIGIRLRSNRPLNQASEAGDGMKEAGRRSNDNAIASSPLESHGGESSPSSSVESCSEDTSSFDPINDEIPYLQVLNRLLPHDIRILAWCPAPPTDFSARFSCKERRYRYFFTQPAFAPSHGPTGFAVNSAGPSYSDTQRREGWLDIEAMRKGAQKFVGSHDFRNFCKVDPSKQIENFSRVMFHADIEEVDPAAGPVGYVGLPGFREHEHPSPDDRDMPDSTMKSVAHTPRIYTFTLHGSAFLWHQVRHMVAILFSIGSGLESPNLVDELLDVQKNPQKPMYEMADDAPLVLWDCIFPREGSGSTADALEWVCIGDYTGFENSFVQAADGKWNGKHGLGGVVDDMWKVWRQRKMDEILAGTLLDTVVGLGDRSLNDRVSAVNNGVTPTMETKKASQKIFQGGDGPRFMGRYIPVLQLPRMQTVEAINTKYANRKGFEKRQEIKDRGFRRVSLS